MGLADAVTAVEIDAAGPGGSRGLLLEPAPLPGPGGVRPAEPRREALRTRTASVWLGWFGSGMYVSKRTASKRGGGTISATRRSAGTWGSRAHRDSGATSAGELGPEAGVEDGTVPQLKGRARLRICDACSL